MSDFTEFILVIGILFLSFAVGGALAIDSVFENIKENAIEQKVASMNSTTGEFQWDNSTFRKVFPKVEE